MFFYLSLIILVLSFGTPWFMPRRFLGEDLKKVFVKIFFFSALLIFGLGFYYSYQQYVVWQSAEPTKYFLPPYASLNYFLQYVGFRIFGPYLVSLAFAFSLLFSMKALNKKYGEKFFYSEEPYAAGLAIFLTGHPGWLFYFVGLVLAYLLSHIFISFYYRFFLRTGLNEIRVSLRYWWIPLAVFAIIISKLIQETQWWLLLKI